MRLTGRQAETGRQAVETGKQAAETGWKAAETGKQAAETGKQAGRRRLAGRQQRLAGGRDWADIHDKAGEQRGNKSGLWATGKSHVTASESPFLCIAGMTFIV